MTILLGLVHKTLAPQLVLIQFVLIGHNGYQNDILMRGIIMVIQFGTINKITLLIGAYNDNYYEKSALCHY